jgi:hypothetical protein
MMRTLEVTLSDNTASKLEETARRLGLSPEELVKVSLEEKMARLDEAFLEAARYVLDKNTELYERLA